MRILYINHYAGSLKYGMEFRPYYLSREWVKNGHNVRIIGGDFSHLRKVNPTVSKDFESETVDGIEYQWIKSGRYSGNGVKRAISMFKFVGKLWLKSKKIAKEFKPDVVISSSTYPLDSYPAHRIAQKAKCKYVHEAHDIWPLTLVKVGGMSKYHPFVVLLSIAERHTYKKADQIVSVLPYSYLHMLKHGLKDSKKFHHIPNGIVLSDWKSPNDIPNEHSELLQNLKQNDCFVVCYVGGHAVSNSLDVLIEAAYKCREDSKIAFVLVGNGVEKERLMQSAKDKAISNVYFLPPVSKEAVPSMLAKADALYIGAKKCDLYQFGVSMNKVYDYMMSGKPIIYGVEASNNDVEEAKCGITIEPDSADAIVNAVYELRNLPRDVLSRMGSNGYTWVVKNCEYNLLSQKFMDIIERG